MIVLLFFLIASILGLTIGKQTLYCPGPRQEFLESLGRSLCILDLKTGDNDCYAERLDLENILLAYLIKDIM